MTSGIENEIHYALEHIGSILFTEKSMTFRSGIRLAIQLESN